MKNLQAQTKRNLIRRQNQFTKLLQQYQFNIINKKEQQLLHYQSLKEVKQGMSLNLDLNDLRNQFRILLYYHLKIST